MVSLDDLRELMIYKKPFYLPMNTTDRRHGSAIMLLTPNYKSSMLTMTLPYTINRKYFESYYLERSVMHFIQNESVYQEPNLGEYLFESTLTSNVRNSLEDSDFGIPSERKYPIPDESHVLAAIRLFNHVEEKFEKELADNIIKRIKKFNMADKVVVGDKNRFKPYWEKSGLSSIQESANIKDEKKSLINNIQNILKDNGLEAHISKNGEWGLDNFISGESECICLGSFNKDTVHKALELIKSNLPENYFANEDNYFTIFINQKHSMKEFTEGEYDQYLAEYVNNSAIKYADYKLSNATSFVFNGYKTDIEKVAKYFNKYSVLDAFDNIDEQAPKLTTIIIANSNKIQEEFTENSLVIYTPEIFSKIGSFKYKDYIKYTLQLYAIYHLTINRSKKILDSLAEPAAILLSGIVSDDELDMYDQFEIERTYRYILEEYGLGELKKLLIHNDTKALMKYSKEYYKEEYANNAIRESFKLIDEEGTTIPTPDNIPESVKHIQNLGSTLKRRIKQHSVYKLNKITRDIQSGNVGSETRSETDIQKILNNDIITLPSIKSESLNYLDSNKDYLLEGNYLYLFESDNYDSQIRKVLFKDRFKTNKDVLNVYNKVKSDLPFIKYTFIDLIRYKDRNIFVDLSYYNESFFRNMLNLNNEDKSNTIRLFNIYLDLMGRLVSDKKFDSYKKKTIFIPILDWTHNNSTKMWMYKEDLNPISVIYHLIRQGNLQALKNVFGNNDIIFCGGRNYFKINFSTTDFSKQANTNKFLTLIKRLISLGRDNADPDPEGEYSDSPSGIAMDIIDKVEKSQNVTINNVSKIDTLKNKEVKLTIPTTSEDEPTPVNMAVKKNVVNAPQGASVSSKETIVPNGKLITKDYSSSAKGTKISTDVYVKTTNISPLSSKEDIGTASDTKSVNSTSEDKKKDAIVDKIVDAVDNATDEDNAIDKLNTEEFKELITSLQNDSEENIRVDKTRASKVIAAEDEFHKKEVAGKSVQELLDKDPSQSTLPSTKLNVASINDDWNHLTFMNFDKDYDLNSDIIKMLDSMQHWTFPVAVKNIDIKDNSTSEDLLDLWSIECIDFRNSRFTLRVDIPKFVHGSNFLKLRGNEKTLMIQSALLPIIKTGLDECQIIGSGGYNKIFVRRFGSRIGQSMPSSNRLIRALNKYISNHNDITIISGDNTKVCTKYELPIDYIDLSNIFNMIETPKTKFYFNQDEFRTEYQIDDTKGLAVGVSKVYDPSSKTATESIMYYSNSKDFGSVSSAIALRICEDCPDFAEIYNSIPSAGGRYTYTKASILDCQIPIIIVCGYLVGLIPTLRKAGIQYEFKQELDKSIRYSDTYDYIKFADGYLVYQVDYSSSLLLNGLKENDTESYSIRDINNRKMYFEFLENYGGSLRADGLENSYDCMIDPITKEILAKFKLPTDYIGVLLHANNMLADNKYVKHIDQAGRRWRRKELIAGYFYKALSTAYQEYANSIRHNRKNSKMEMKQSAIIDMIVSKDPATSDLSINNALNDVECSNSVTNKGLVGMNVARGYTINTRGYDDSMLNLLGMDTGFSGNVGINRQATINANIEGGRGFVKTIDNDVSKLSSASAFTMTEAITPFGSTHDDPPRTLMTYVQTSKHMIRCENNDPTLITTGADEALPYLSSNIFANKAKKDGQVIELVENGFGKENYMIIEYKDGTHDYINLSEEVKKNSDGGYYVPLKLDTDLKVGSKFKAGDIIAYDKLSFSNSLGESGNLAANIGTLAKVAIINTDEGFEDSAAITESFANKIGTEVIMNIDSKVDKGSNIFVYKEIGDNVMEGDTLFAVQADFDDDVASVLLKNLTMDADQLSELGRNPVKSKYTGIVENIEIYRTCELEDMTPSLREFVSKHEAATKKIKSIYEKYGLETNELPPTNKVPEIGKAKNLNNGVLINYYIKYVDRMSVGDKIVFYSANKGIIKYIIPKEDEPYTDFRPNEHVDSFMSLSSISGRMTCSIPLFAATSKLMVELDRSVKELAGIPYDESKL